MVAHSSKAGDVPDAVFIEDLEEVPTVAEKHDGDTLDPDLHVKTALQHGDDLDTEVVKKLMRKIDFRLIPALGAIYAFALIDRNNLPIARLAGMDEELDISVGNRYSLLSMMFFIPYVLFEIPSNIAIRKVGPAKWIGGIGFLWGVVTLCMAVTNTWTELLVCRIFFGAFEAGLFPGSIYLMSCWYTRYEVQTRFSGFYSLGLLCSGLSSLIGYGIQQMNGVRGLLAWRWLFILEGIASCVVAIPAFFLLLDFPDRAARPALFRKRGFLTNAEVSIVLARISRDRGDAVPEKFTFRKLLVCFSDWKIWEFASLILCNNMIVYSFSLFLPLILKNGFGFTLELTYILLFPPYVAAVIWMFFVAWLGDKLHIRGPIIFGNAVITILGVSMMAFLSQPTARYVGAFLGIASCTSNIPAIFSYSHNNTVGQLKRAIASALMVGAGGCGGIISSNVFRQQDAPRYIPGLITAIALQGVTLLIVGKNLFYFTWQNRKADREEKVLEGVVGYRYTL